MNYKQLTENERYQIDVMNTAGYINPAFNDFRYSICLHCC